MSSFGVHTPDFPSTGCALVFGATGGIGAATAGLLAERGCDVVMTYRSRRTEADELADSIRSLGHKATTQACDVTDREAVATVVETALAEHGRIHTVVSAAGLVFRTRPLIEFTDDEFADVIHTDVLGFFNIAKATVPALRAGGGGSITALITTAVDRTVPTDALSATPKAAVAMMMRMLATEEAVNGIRANAVGPGVVEGEWFLRCATPTRSPVIFFLLPWSRPHLGASRSPKRLRRRLSSWPPPRLPTSPDNG